MDGVIDEEDNDHVDDHDYIDDYVDDYDHVDDYDYDHDHVDDHDHDHVDDYDHVDDHDYAIAPNCLNRSNRATSFSAR